MRFRERVRLRIGQAILGSLWLLKWGCRPVFLRPLYRLVVVRLIKRSGLFDRGYYLDSNPDVAQAGGSPIGHYALYGDREGRPPIPVFDPVYYRARARGRTRRVNALLHYLYVGRYLRISPSPWFDVHYYLTQNKDVARAGVEPIRHYLKYGGAEGRSPNPQFDGAYYLRNNPEVRAAHLNPLLHYIQSGYRDVLPTRPANEEAATESVRLPTSETDWALVWDTFAPFGEATQSLVDVIIPVYRDRELTLRCILSVLSAKCETPFELIAIDDATPEATLAADLDELARRGLITLLRNPTNSGFVKSVNLGMRLHPERHVVLLNSDTEVYPGWLDRLHRCAHRSRRTATATPLSNNATICSYPRFLHDNPYPLETGYATLDQFAARVNSGVEVAAPTGVGFCMYIRRDAIHEVGFFDEEAFGKGYGEENDFCQRAIRYGWQNVIAADVFVRHLGGASFQGEKAQRVACALQVLARRYPDYGRSVDAFIRDDPLAEARGRLDWERLRRQVRNENVLIVCHNRGGGAERHVQEDTQRFFDEGKGVFYLRPERGLPTHARIVNPACRQLLNLRPFQVSDTSSLAAALQALQITRIHSHGLVDFTAEFPLHLEELSRILNVPLHVDIHDYKVICPRINLVDEHGRYCGEPDDHACNNCLSIRGNDFGVADIRQWRRVHRQVLSAAEAIWVPSEDVAERLAHYYPDIECRITPHEDEAAFTEPRRALTIRGNENLRIVVIGAIGKIKGFDVLLSCAKDAQKRRLPLQFIVMGYSLNDRLLEQAGVIVTGRYLEHDACAQLRELDPHLIWLPSIWPETYSYTLSIALKAGVSICAFDIGAIARRLRKVGRGDELYPVSDLDPKVLNTRFERFRHKLLDLSNETLSQHPSSEDRPKVFP